MQSNTHPPLPAWLIQHLKNRPAQGSGLHQWICRTACLISEHVTQDEAALIHILTEACQGAARDTSREIRDAVHFALHRDPITPHAPKWPPRYDAQIAAILSSGYTEAQLMKDSPQRFEGNAKDMLELLFPGDPLLCIGFHTNEFDTLRRSAWTKLMRTRSRPQFIVPSPMSARTGTTTSGKPSAKTNANTGPRQYLVVEFDFKPTDNPADARLLQHGKKHGLHTTRDMCAALAHHLAQRAPLALVIWSGGKSLHCWFPVLGVPEETLIDFFREACRIGADRATWTPSQFVRFPCGFNTKHHQQQPVIFFNPATLKPTPKL